MTIKADGLATDDVSGIYNLVNETTLTVTIEVLGEKREILEHKLVYGYAHE